MTFLVLVLAGGLGAVARFTLDTLIRLRAGSSFPVGTIVVNLTGSLLLGLMTGLVLFQGGPSELRTVVGTGFLGGYTTFSTASFETARLVQQGRIGAALVNGLGTLLLTVLAAAAGLGLAALV